MHDDVLILDSAANPTLISFFQVKTRDTGRPWTRADLLNRAKGKEGSRKPSILGKLYTNKLQFPEATKSLTFVTNAPISIPLTEPPPSTSRTAFRHIQVQGFWASVLFGAELGGVCADRVLRLCTDYDRI